MLPETITADLGSLIRELEEIGYRVRASRSAEVSFGDYVVEIAGPAWQFSIVRERSQYYVSGPPRELLEAAGLWGVFDNQAELGEYLLRWLDAV